MHSVGDPGPFRGRKRSLYDGGTHMALLARWPGTVPQGVVSSAQIMSADWLPTAAAFAGLTVPHDPAGSQPAPFGEDRRADFAPKTAPRPAPRTLPIMFDYRADGCSSPRLVLLPRFLVHAGWAEVDICCCSQMGTAGIKHRGWRSSLATTSSS